MTGMVGEVCSGATFKAGGVVWEITVKVPAHTYVTEFERSSKTATHGQKNLALCLWSVKAACQSSLCTA
jgi:hypothetical protein